MKKDTQSGPVEKRVGKIWKNWSDEFEGVGRWCGGSRQTSAGVRFLWCATQPHKQYTHTKQTNSHSPKPQDRKTQYRHRGKPGIAVLGTLGHHRPILRGSTSRQLVWQQQWAALVECAILVLSQMPQFNSPLWKLISQRCYPGIIFNKCNKIFIQVEKMVPAQK